MLRAAFVILAAGSIEFTPLWYQVIPGSSQSGVLDVASVRVEKHIRRFWTTIPNESGGSFRSHNIIDCDAETIVLDALTSYDAEGRPTEVPQKPDSRATPIPPESIARALATLVC